jgi:hypothetical protein
VAKNRFALSFRTKSAGEQQRTAEKSREEQRRAEKSREEQRRAEKSREEQNPSPLFAKGGRPSSG